MNDDFVKSILYSFVGAVFMIMAAGYGALLAMIWIIKQFLI